MHRAASILVSVSVSGQYQHFLMVLESVMYVIQVRTNSVVCEFKMNFQGPL